MPFKNKEDYNRYRIKYRNRAYEQGKCKRCYRELIEDSGNLYCVNCLETAIQNTKLRRNFMGDN